MGQTPLFMMLQYRSHGKFLLTGEYLVLKGALALAVPLKLGQSIEVVELDSDDNRLSWEAWQPEGRWFVADFERSCLDRFSTDQPSFALRLAHILNAVKKLNPKAFEGRDLKITTRLDFHREWGLGSSSTLVANLARWADVDPYELLKLTFGGSGYDIACATADGPIYYQIKTDVPAPAVAESVVPEQGRSIEGPPPMVKPIDFQPPFAEHLFFVYQGQKQSSSKEVKAFLEKTKPVDLQNDIKAVSEISRSMVHCQSLDEFGLLMQCHERIIARCIVQEPVQKRFPDFEGVLKSLGAWGGDFILAATEWSENQVKAYFQEQGLDVVFGYKEMVL